MKNNVLENMTLYELRELGRGIGVKSPSSLRKKQLIEKILKIQKGEEKPTFSCRGRPVVRNKVYDSYNEQHNIKKEKIKLAVEEFLIKIFKIMKE